MNNTTRDRWLIALLGMPLILSVAVSAGLVLHVSRSETEPPAISLGNFHLRAWLLPRAYRGLHPVAYIGEASAAVSTISQGSGRSNTVLPNTLLRLQPDGSGGLKLSERNRYRAIEPAEQWLANDEVLTMPFSGGYSSTAQQTPLALLRPLSHFDGGGSATGQFDLGFNGVGAWWYCLLDADRIAVLEDPLANSGSARLRVGKRNGIAQVRQTIPDAVALGDAWENGMTLAVLARPDRLFVLDRTTEELVERRDLRSMAESAINSTPGMFCFYFSGSSLITVNSVRTKLYLHSHRGKMQEIQIVRPQTYGYQSQQTGGLLRRLFLGSASLFPRDGYLDEERRLRREGRSAALNKSASQTGNIILPCGPDRFVLVDDVYQRLVVIEHSARDQGIRSA